MLLTRYDHSWEPDVTKTTALVKASLLGKATHMVASASNVQSISAGKCDGKHNPLAKPDASAANAADHVFSNHHSAASDV